MRKFRKPRCPYCGKKIGLASAWALRTQGEYLCPKCGGISNIVLDPGIYLLAFAAILVSAVFFTLALLNFVAFDLWLLLLVLLPFLLFYLISAFLVRLRKPPARKGPPPPGRGPQGPERPGGAGRS